MPTSKRDVKYSTALFYFEKYFLVRDCLGGNSFGEILRKSISSLSLDCLSKGKCCHWKMASVLAPTVQLKAKECASKPSKGLQQKGDAFISPEIYRAHFLSSPHTTWGHSTSPFFKFTVFIWYLCCMRANSRHSSSGVWVSPKQGNGSSPRNTHLPSAFPFSHSFLCSHCGNCVMFIVEVIGKEQSVLKWVGKGKSGDRAAPTVVLKQQGLKSLGPSARTLWSNDIKPWLALCAPSTQKRCYIKLVGYFRSSYLLNAQ